MPEQKTQNKYKAFDVTLLLTSTAIPLGFVAWYAAKHKKLPTAKYMVKEAFSTPVGTLLSLDLLLSSLAFVRLAHEEIQTERSRGPLGLYVLLNTCVALSAAMPLLFLRRKTK